LKIFQSSINQKFTKMTKVIGNTALKSDEKVFMVTVPKNEVKNQLKPVAEAKPEPAPAPAPTP
jgi:hypothetical protein